MAGLLLGIDCGLTVTKAAIYADNGVELGIASIPLAHTSPHPRWIERDMGAVQTHVSNVIRQALDVAGVDGGDIAAIGVTGHGDGLYLVDKHGDPVRPAILSMDSRAVDLLAQRAETGQLDAALALTGQVPFPGSTAALLAWVAEHEPENLGRTRYLLSCKDWIKFGLTGEISTDPTDASATFTDVHSQRYSAEALDLYGLDAVREKLPVVVPSTHIAGRVTARAAERTGLAPGTPVISGLHDVDACAIGVGAVSPGVLSIVAGSFSINQTVASQPHVDARWLCRNFIEPGQWLHLGVSPASASNLEWFVSELLSIPGTQGMSRSELFGLCEAEVQATLARPREVWYLPFLYGSPLDNNASAAFVGVRGWHSRGDLIRALFEGVVLNHLWHIRALATAFDLTDARLTGGGSRSPSWGQMFADAIDLPVSVTGTDESGALGTAICAGIGAGHYASLDEAIAALVRIRHTYEPRADRHADLADAFATYERIAASLRPIWSSLA